MAGATFDLTATLATSNETLRAKLQQATKLAACYGIRCLAEEKKYEIHAAKGTVRVCGPGEADSFTFELNGIRVGPIQCAPYNEICA